VKRAVLQLFIIGFLAVQLALPVRAFIFDKRSSRGNFTWNMYSQKRSCRVDYRLERTDGTEEKLDYRRYFVRKSRASHVLFPDTLPYFHEWLCTQTAGERAALRARISCTLNGSPRFQVTDPTKDVCSDPNWGLADR
jgi:hypothetical protein